VVTPATGGLYDIRSLNILQLNDDLLDDTKVFFKDRDSTDAVSNPVLGKVTFKDRIHGDEDLTLSADKSMGIGFTETDNIAEGLQVHIKGGTNRGAMKIEQTSANEVSSLYLKNDSNEWGLLSDASPDELTLGRVTTIGAIASTINSDIKIDGSTGDVTIGENLTVDGESTFTGTTHTASDATFAKGVGIGYTNGEDVADGELALKTGTGDGVISITTSDAVGHAKLTLNTNSGTDFTLEAKDTGTFGIGRGATDDIAIDSTGKLVTGEVMALNDVEVRSGLTAGGDVTGASINLEVKDSADQV
jgi:hypothetical protein